MLSDRLRAALSAQGERSRTTTGAGSSTDPPDLWETLPDGTETREDWQAEVTPSCGSSQAAEVQLASTDEVRGKLRGRPPSGIRTPVFVEYGPSDPAAGMLNLRGGSPLSMGRLLSFGDAVQTQSMEIYLLQRCALAPCMVTLLAYTFDYPDLVEALKRVGRNSHARVELIADKRESLGRSTRDQTVSLQSLASCGVQVRVAEGRDIRQEYANVGRQVPPARGIHHRKCLFVFLHGGPVCQAYCVIGSTNFTTSSRSNQELSVLLALNDYGVQEAEGIIDRARRASVVMTESVVQEAEEERNRRQGGTRMARSVGPARAPPPGQWQKAQNEVGQAR